MCGIIWIKRKDGKDVREQCAVRFDAQRRRGTQGFGFVAIKDGHVIAYERGETEEEIGKKLREVPCDEILFHHRFPTSTPNFRECAHPIKVSNDKLVYDYYIIHNGIIHNDYLWKEDHEKEGFVYTTEIRKQYLRKDKLLEETTVWNDSEALAIELAKDLDGEQKGVEVCGSIAFLALQVEKGGTKAIKMFAGKNTQDLDYDEWPTMWIYFASEGGHGARGTTGNTLYIYDYTTGDRTDKPYHVGNEFTYDYEDAKASGWEGPADDEIGSLCAEWDKIDDELHAGMLSKEREDFLIARRDEIEEMVTEIDETAYKTLLLE